MTRVAVLGDVGGHADQLREWWADGRMQVAAAITANGDEFLLTHAGLTLAAWQQLGEPASAARAADLLNERPELMWHTGAHARDEQAGPLWAESGAALHEPWMRYDGIVPFGQIHGHSTVVHFGHQRWRCEGRVRQRATVDWHARHVRVRVGGRLFIGVDPATGARAPPAGGRCSSTTPRSTRWPPDRGQMTRFSRSVNTRPATDRIVSMIDQVLMFWPTLTPK